MHYLTEYSLTVQSPHPLTVSEVQAITNKLSDASLLGYAFENDSHLPQNNCLAFSPAFPVPWYDSQQDLRILSLAFPAFLFTLTGRGENPGDLWQRYFKNGRVQHEPAIITFNPPDAHILGDLQGLEGLAP